jgi:hypothetical protein
MVNYIATILEGLYILKSIEMLLISNNNRKHILKIYIEMGIHISMSIYISIKYSSLIFTAGKIT